MIAGSCTSRGHILHHFVSCSRAPLSYRRRTVRLPVEIFIVLAHPVVFRTVQKSPEESRRRTQDLWFSRGTDHHRRAVPVDGPHPAASLLGAICSYVSQSGTIAKRATTLGIRRPSLGCFRRRRRRRLDDRASSGLVLSRTPRAQRATAAEVSRRMSVGGP